MALGTFTVGRDAQAVFIAPNGVRFDLSGVTDFDWTPEYKTARSDLLNGPPIERFLPAGHRLRFTVDRNGPANDTLVTAIEAGWWAVGSADPGTSANGTAFFFINEVDGSQTTWSFAGMTIKVTQGGDFKTDQPIKQTFEGYAQRKLT
jgi:hypothetical protein